MSKVKLYKVTSLDGSACHGGSGTWDLPKGSKPGHWMPKVADPECCKRGYHLVTAGQLFQWLDATPLSVWEAEAKGKAHEQARLLRKVGDWTAYNARMFAADCAEHVLPIFEKAYPKDDRPRKAIEASRAFARGEITAAARDAAWDAAWDAAGAAAWAAAWDAAWDAGGAAAGDAAWDAEQKWQTKRLLYWLKRPELKR